MTDAKELAEHPRNLADRDFLLRAAKDIVADGDARGTAAKHSTTIWTRQVIEALVKVVEAPANIGDERRRPLSDNDLYYLRSIYRQMMEFQEALADTARFTLAGEAMADNLNWLDCFIDQHQRAALPANTGGE